MKKFLVLVVVIITVASCFLFSSCAQKKVAEEGGTQSDVSDLPFDDGGKDTAGDSSFENPSETQPPEQENTEDGEQNEDNNHDKLYFVFSPDGSGGVVLTEADTDSRIIDIPSQYEGLPVVAIGAGAFSGNETLVEVNIPSSVTRIEAYAFDGCYNLAKVVFGNTCGWSAGKYSFQSSALENNNTSAVYLRKTFCGYEWIRISEN